MAVDLDLAAILAGAIIVVILIASAVLWIVHLQRDQHKFACAAGVPAWPIGWINFGIFACTLVSSVVVVQLFAGELIYLMNPIEAAAIDNEVKLETSVDLVSSEDSLVTEPTALTPWMAVLAVLLLQLPLLGAFCALRRFYPRHFSSRLNNQRLTLWQSFAYAIPQFIRYLPIIWFVSFTWSKLLTELQELGVIDEFPPQELIKLFTNGGDLTAISLLAVFAVVLAPIVEEIVFRGGIYRFLKSQSSVLTAQIISGALFATMHGNLMSFLPLLVIGIILARQYEGSGNILVPICFHAYFNGFNLLMLLIMSQSSFPIN
ncbi:MAG: CPBP family intramembrane metalloprotease [Opitutae bacterium]|nr:CPBP family intramembrane metalloprotease [Opitutae bacterium]MDG1301539.1 CPBP family intramembrane metalloprotease [Opitutae bacterium]